MKAVHPYLNFADDPMGIPERDLDTFANVGLPLRALSVGGGVELPLGPTDWPELYASFTDRVGVRWRVNYTGDASCPLPPRAGAPDR